MSLLTEYLELENRVEESFTEKRKQFNSLEFLVFNPETENEDDFQGALEECPTSYYNHKHSGEEKHVYITKIDSEGIHIIESDDFSNKRIIGLNDLNGLYYKINLLEAIENRLNNIKNLSIAQKVFSSWEGELESAIRIIEKHADQDDLIDYLHGFQVCEAFEFTFTCKEFLEFIK